MFMYTHKQKEIHTVRYTFDFQIYWKTGNWIRLIIRYDQKEKMYSIRLQFIIRLVQNLLNKAVFAELFLSLCCNPLLLSF